MISDDDVAWAILAGELVIFAVLVPRYLRSLGR